MIASALCPQLWARLSRSFTSVTPSISLIFVWQCSSTRFLGAVSFLDSVKSLILRMPATDEIVNSPSNLSMAVTPLTFKKLPSFTSPRMSGSCSFLRNNLILIVSVKSVTAKVKIVFSLRISLVSILMTFPRNVISPISPITWRSSIGSSSKSRP